MFILQPQSGTPIYRQLVDQVRRMVASGQLAPGAELPSVRELAERHTVHHMTISKAYSLLEAEGLLVRNPGRPMTVAPVRRAATSTSTRLRQLDGQVAALVLSARQLQLGKDEVLHYLDTHWEDSHG